MKERLAHVTAVDRKHGLRTMSTSRTLLVDELVDGGLITRVDLLELQAQYRLDDRSTRREK